MIITKRIDSTITDSSIDICAKSKEDLKEVLEALQNLDNTINGIQEKKHFQIRVKDILYFESVDKKTFAYTHNEVYEITMWLYELEKTLSRSFFRCSKSVIVNLSKVQSFSPSFNSKIIVSLINGEKVSVSRKYVNLLKLKFKGVK